MPRRRPLFDPFPLPFGDEFDALSMGYAELGKRNALAQGFNRAAYKANQNLIRDTPTGFIVVDMTDGPVGRSMSYADIYAAYKTDLRKAGVSKADNLHHAFKANVGLKRGQKLSFPDGLPGQHTWNLRPGVYIANAGAIRQANAAAKAAAKASPSKLLRSP